MQILPWKPELFSFPKKRMEVFQIYLRQRTVNNCFCFHLRELKRLGLLRKTILSYRERGDGWILVFKFKVYSSQRFVGIKEKKQVLKRKEILPCGLAGYVRHDNNQKINSAASGNDNFVRTTKRFFSCVMNTQLVRSTKKTAK